ncbi:HERC2 [Symbiodinium natans]|uniref:HERC2 protein n=1 Tax=Symbiodinium natans TaxID=878477 RepID=A0A812S609_9DINO|nr:HERC2 [Symbiodinium natans]
MQLVKTGWTTVLNAVENYNLGQPSCSPSAFLVLGSPGSGKSCFVGRLMMEMLDRYENLIPLMLPVADLVKRSDPEGPDAFDADAVQDWFDNYLRLTYGEDSLRYSMIGQAISMSRVVFLFEGLEDAERLTKAVESLIRVLVRSKNLVVVTSRPLLSGRSALESDPELIMTMRLENLSDEQKRMVAYARLGAEGIEAYDKLLARLRSSQNVSDQGEEAANDGAEDVFGNPMMLSMLLCYLQTMAKKYAEKKETEGEELDREAKEEETTLTAVYRVAVDATGPSPR